MLVLIQIIWILFVQEPLYQLIGGQLVQISHLNTMENVFNIYDYNLKILFHLVCCKWLILCGTKKLIFLIFSYFSTNHILFKWLSLLKLYTLNCENVDTKKSINNGQWDLTAFMVRCTW